jgi:hypothetical protein
LGALPRAAVRFHDNVHVLAKRDKKAEQPLNRELLEITAQQFRNIGLPDT